jgi:serine/threonine protein kinase
MSQTSSIGPTPAASASNQPFLGEMFGNFLLLSKVTSGGMAAIYLARPADSAANGRILVVKRILPQAANDPDFLQMFKSEIRICMGFNHQNIVQIYDFGQVAHQPYIAMELVEGKNLRELLNQLGRKGQPLPVGVAVSIAAQAAAGLHYAHTFQNRVTGESLKVIHRDVSPQNILVGYDGNVKVIDFGIAKTFIDDVEQTQTGSIKGKVSYLSPEQVKRESLDAYSDVFSLGAVLWELLTGQKLFSMIGRDDMEIMQMIKDCGTTIRTPSKLNPNVTKQLDDIVMKALHPSKTERYQTAEEFQKAPRDYIVFALLGFGYKDVAQCIRATFADEMKTEREFIRQLNQQGQTFLEEKVGRDKTSVTMPEAVAEVPVYRGAGATNPMINMQAPGILAKVPNSPFVVAVPANMDLSASWTSFPRQEKVSVLKPTRLKLLMALLYVSTIWFLKVDQEYFFFQRFFLPSEVVRLASMDPPAIRQPASYRNSSLPGPTPSVHEVLLKLNITPALHDAKTTIFLNNKKIDAPMNLVKVPLDQKVALRVERKGSAPYRNEFVLKSAQFSGSKLFKLDVPLSKKKK